MTRISETLIDIASMLAMVALFKEAAVCGLSNRLLFNYLLTLLWLVMWEYGCGWYRGCKP
jgi:hypothetical protein